MGKVDLKVEADAELVALANARGVSLDAAFEDGLRRALSTDEARDPELAKARARAWANENAQAIAVHNRRITERGIFGADLRRW
ncbi:MAG TPA: type II toxin-antitoxin system CcdA family antitoxin [Caulobacteraceae bacterium]|jgi:antitoxin CcdA|nr:type II toxin-antitoxin system CcdA family antitoxin [Caulobacteraceae bacterium]